MFINCILCLSMGFLIIFVGGGSILSGFWVFNKINFDEL